MFFKLLKTRFFAENFNACVDSVSRKLGAWGVVLGYALYLPLVFAILSLVHFVWGLPIDCYYDSQICRIVEMSLFDCIVMFAFVSGALLIRFFAQKYSAKVFLSIMLLPFLPLLLNLAPYRFIDNSVGLDTNYLIFSVVETVIIAFVLLNKLYSNYRAFQVVGSLLIVWVGALLYFADISGNVFDFTLFAGSKIFLGAIFVFWILSTAHILFRDKLLDYLEKKNNMAEEKNF